MVFKELPDLVHMYDLSLGKEAIAEMRRKFGNKQLQEGCNGVFQDEQARDILTHDVADHGAAIHDELALLLASVIAQQQTMFKADVTKRDVRRMVTGQMLEICTTLMVYSIIDDLKANTVYQGFAEEGIHLTENMKDMAFVATQNETIRGARRALENLTRTMFDEFMQIYCKGVYDKAKKRS